MGRERHTPVSSIRIPVDLKAAAKAKAEEEGHTVSDVIVVALREYVGWVYTKCDTCGERAIVNANGSLRKHKP